MSLSPTIEIDLVKSAQVKTQQTLPRLLYVGDVGVEATVAGSALLYRLLSDYTASDLRIVEGNIWESKPAARLKNVAYDILALGRKSFYHTRLNSLYTAYLFLTASSRAAKLQTLVREFQPEALLTVAHGFSWLTAAALARREKLPLHLVCHDDWPTTNSLPPMIKSRKRPAEQFGKVYRQAQTRLCASPYMVEEYEQKYGVRGETLYPSRAADVPDYSSPRVVKEAAASGLTFAYAGSINSGGYADALASLAAILEDAGCRLLIYSSLSEASLRQYRLDGSNVTVRPFVPSGQLIRTLHAEADVLFVPMDFDAASQGNMRTAFPSKIPDYTATGLPLLIYGPPYCSAVRWALENGGVAEVVQENDDAALAQAVRKLIEDAEYRFMLAQTALIRGREFFSHEIVSRQFQLALSARP